MCGMKSLSRSDERRAVLDQSSFDLATRRHTWLGKTQWQPGHSNHTENRNERM